MAKLGYVIVDRVLILIDDLSLIISDGLNRLIAVCEAKEALSLC